MKHKITHRIREHDYNVSKGQIRIVYESTAHTCSIEYFFMKIVKNKPTDAEFKTLESMRTCCGIGWPGLIGEIKSILRDTFEGVNAWKSVWKCDINKSKILNDVGLSKALRRKLASLETISKNRVDYEIRDSITGKFCDAIDGSQSFRELWQNMADAGNEITAMARKRRENSVRKQYAKELEKMIQDEQEERLAAEKYKDITLDEMEGLWNSSDSYGRMELAKSVPFFKTHIEGLGFSEEHGNLLRDEVFCYEFREENENGDCAVEFFERHCKK